MNHLNLYDNQIFKATIEILTNSALGEKSYGFIPDCTKSITYRELARVCNKQGLSTNKGKPLDREYFKQLFIRVRSRNNFINIVRPNWSSFERTETTEMVDCKNPNCDSETTMTESYCSPHCEKEHQLFSSMAAKVN
jgi:hypothetical protein